ALLNGDDQMWKVVGGIALAFVACASAAHAANDEAPWSGECPRYVTAPKPVYPEKARTQNAEGTVLVAANIGTDGKAIRTFVIKSSGWVDLDVAALRAVKAAQWEAGRPEP